MVWVSHDYVDRVWDGLLIMERKYWEGCYVWLLLHPEILKAKFGIDVLRGRVHQLIQSREIWEECPKTKYEYERLLRYVKKVRGNDQALQMMLEQYG